MAQDKEIRLAAVASADDGKSPRETPAQRLDGVRVLVLFGGSDLFGQERANIEVFRSLAPLGLKAKFIISSKWGRHYILPELQQHGFEWTMAPFGYQWTRYMLGKHFGYFLLNLYGVISTGWRVWREARCWRATHIYAGNWLYWVYAAPLIPWLRLPLVFRAGDQLSWRSWFHRWTGRRLLHNVDCLVCNCEFLRQRFLALESKAERTRVIYNYPATRREDEGPEMPEPPSGGTLVLYVGQVAEHKGVPVLIETAEELLRAGKVLTVWIAGESVWGNETVARLRKRVEGNGWLQHIRFLGYRSNVTNLMRRADIHVCPSVWEEPSPNVVFEAKREGVPSVVFPVGGIPELVEHGVDGYVCRECTPEALVEGIQYFLQDPTRRRRAGEAARRSLDERFGQERFRRQWAEVFLETSRKRD
ncbi:MAG: glycosyltransferase family 4 protein [Verrucomicrobia bacterium]|nr:glycosyltransferase family 4 protein [Verrucomicrobiota bacterium]